MLYPNPSRNSSSVVITGITAGVTVIITDISGKTLWTTTNNKQSQINLPVSMYLQANILFQSQVESTGKY